MEELSIITTLTERGQTSIPSVLRKALALRTGQRLRWQQISNHEIRVEVMGEEAALGPMAMLGYARRFHPQDSPVTDDIMRELREGDSD